MGNIDPNTLWFQLPDTHTLCRAGGNGPEHPSQLYAIDKYVIPMARQGEISFLDYGMGSATTFEAMEKSYPVFMDTRIRYRGLDIIPKNVEWCKQNFSQGEFVYNPSIHKIDEPDKFWDVVYSRHVVDHMDSFERAMDEHKRVAKKLVIVVLWVPLRNLDEHDIKNIVDHRGTPNEKLYPNEYTNNYSGKLVKDYLTSDPEWQLLELTEDVGSEVSGHDTVIVLRRNG